MAGAERIPPVLFLVLVLSGQHRAPELWQVAHLPAKTKTHRTLTHGDVPLVFVGFVAVPPLALLRH